MNHHSPKNANPEPILSSLHLILLSFLNTPFLWLKVGVFYLQIPLCCMDHCPWPDWTTQPLVWKQGIAKICCHYEKSHKVKTMQPPSKQVTKLLCSTSWSQAFLTPYSLAHSFSWVLSVKLLTHTDQVWVPIQALGTVWSLQVPKPQGITLCFLTWSLWVT